MSDVGRVPTTLVTEQDPETGLWSVMQRRLPTEDCPEGGSLGRVVAGLPDEREALEAAAVMAWRGVLTVDPLIAGGPDVGLRVRWLRTRPRPDPAATARHHADAIELITAGVRWMCTGEEPIRTSRTYLYDPRVRELEGRAVWINGKPFALSLQVNTDERVSLLAELQWSRGFHEWVDKDDARFFTATVKNSPAAVRFIRTTNPTGTDLNRTPYFVLEMEARPRVDRKVGRPAPRGWYDPPR